MALIRLITLTTSGTLGLTIADSYFAANVGVSNGQGYILNVNAGNAAGIVFARNHILGAPDSVVTSTNLASVVYQDNPTTEPISRSPPALPPSFLPIPASISREFIPSV